jgi:hypothetical protein
MRTWNIEKVYSVRFVDSICFIVAVYNRGVIGKKGNGKKGNGEKGNGKKGNR